MVYKLNSKNVLIAVDYIIKDVDKKFDECLVDKFLEFIESEVKTCKDWFRESKPIVDRLNSFINHKAFVMLNQARAFKTTYSILKARQLNEAELEHVKPLLLSVWHSVGMIIVNSNLSAMTVMLSIFEHLISFRTGYLWMLDCKIEPPLKLASSLGYEIKDVSSLARYYIETSNNYHTKNRAEKFFETLIVSSIEQYVPSIHPQTLAIKQAIKELMLSGSTSMVCILIYILKNLSRLNMARSSFLEWFGISDVIQESFLILIERPKINMNNFCRCLALADTSRNFGTILDKLKSKNHLEGIIIYLSTSKCLDSDFNQLSLTYLLYPILTRCDNDDSDMLINRLVATRDERDFIDKNMNDRLVTLCLVQLKYIFEDPAQTNHFTSRSFILIMDTLVNYVKCHIGKTQSYKNVMECCSVIEELQHLSSLIWHSIPSLVPLLQQSPGNIHDILETISRDDSEHMKPILLRLLKILRHSHRSLSKLLLYRETTHSDMLKTLELSFKFEDHDIMNEFALFYRLNSFPFSLGDNNVDRYVELVWNHMYMNAKDTDHCELLGNLAHLLIEIDLVVAAPILGKYEISRHHEIPELLGDILKKRSAIIPTVKLIVEAIVATKPDPDDYRFTGYLCRLDDPKLPIIVRLKMDNLASGLCATVKGEAGEPTQSEVLRILSDLAKIMVYNCNNSNFLLQRLSRNGILDILYDLATCSVYPRKLYEAARPTIELIKYSVIGKISNPCETTMKYHIYYSSDNHDLPKTEQLMSKHRSIAEFYTSDRVCLREEGKPSKETVSDNLALYSLVDDILNYELISDGISDCY